MLSAVKALMNALIVANGDKPLRSAKDDKEREWVKEKARTAPTRSMYSPSKVLRGSGPVSQTS